MTLFPQLLDINIYLQTKCQCFHLVGFVLFMLQQNWFNSKKIINIEYAYLWVSGKCSDISCHFTSSWLFFFLYLIYICLQNNCFNLPSVVHRTRQGSRRLVGSSSYSPLIDNMWPLFVYLLGRILLFLYVSDKNKNS